MARNAHSLVQFLRDSQALLTGRAESAQTASRIGLEDRGVKVDRSSGEVLDGNDAANVGIEE